MVRVCVCVRGIHLCVQTLNPVSAKNMREKHFDRFSSRPRRGTLDVTTTLFTGGRKVRGGLSLLKVGDAGEQEENTTARLHVSLFVLLHLCVPTCLYPIHLFIHPHTVSIVSFSVCVPVGILAISNCSPSTFIMYPP